MKAGSKKFFIEIANEVGSLVQQKNEAYGDSFAKSQDIVKILFPDGVKPHQYRDMLAVTRVIDKLFRIATSKDAFGESPWRDICGYAILGIANDEGDKREQQQEQEQEQEKQQQEEPYVIPPEIVRQLVVQRVRDRKDEGHGNPYANIDERGEKKNNDKRDARLSYDNSKDGNGNGNGNGNGILNTSEQALLHEAITEEEAPKVEPTALLELFPNLSDILVRLEKEDAEGNKEKDAQNLEHWSNAVTDAGNIPSE